MIYRYELEDVEIDSINISLGYCDYCLNDITFFDKYKIIDTKAYHKDCYDILHDYAEGELV